MAVYCVPGTCYCSEDISNVVRLRYTCSLVPLLEVMCLLVKAVTIKFITITVMLSQFFLSHELIVT